MLFFIFFISLCLDLTDLFPLRVGNHQARHRDFLFVMDCQGELLEQKRFTRQLVTHFMSKSNSFDQQYRDPMCVVNGARIRNEDIGYELTCNTTLPISEVLNISRDWQMNQSNNAKKYVMFLSIVFLHNVTDSKGIHENVSKTIEKEKDLDEEIYRFFIIQSTENNFIFVDFVHRVLSFKDLKVDDIFYKIFDMSHVDVSFKYTNYYLKSTYYMTNNVSEVSNKEAEDYCFKEHSSSLPSIETLDEAIFIFQYIHKLSFQVNTKSLNIHLSLKRQRPLSGFYWASANFFWHYNNLSYSDPTSCFYINLAYDDKNFLLFRNDVRDFGKRITSIHCQEKVSQTPVLCEYNEYHNFHGSQTSPENNVLWSTKQFQLKTKRYSMDRLSFLDFIDMVLSSETNMFTKHYSDGMSENSCKNPLKMCLIYDINICIIDHKYTDGALEKYACNNGFLKKLEIESPEDKKRYLVVVSNENKPIYTFNTVDISQCERYELCENEMASVNNSNKNFSLDCLDKNMKQISNGACFKQVVNDNSSLKYFQCETDLDHYFYKCIKDSYGQCEDNSNLQNCENFTCPEPFVKCPNSYCVFPYMNGQFDCPFGEEEILKGSIIYCEVTFSFILKDLCIDKVSFDTFSTLHNQSDFICQYTCPLNYRCISSQIESKSNVTLQTKRAIRLYHSAVRIYRKFGKIFPHVNEYRYFNLFSIVQLKTGLCRVSDFDRELELWDMTELFILDLSGNNLNHSDQIRSIELLTKLKKLNLSNNVDFILIESFTFPSLIEVIDLYHTKVQTLRASLFKNLLYLRYLNLSYTSITRFKDMGIPAYFTLNTLHIEGILIQNIGVDLFKGLTINSGLWASNYIICCPLILNVNISVDKCHAPFDIISSCKHLVGETLKRIVIWIVGILTIVGNGIVLVYRIGWNREIFKKAYGHFITGLALSDFIMGMYLVTIACVDVYYKDVYMLEDFQWRNSFLCRFTGFLSTLSSETSTFFICLITLDRFLSITYPFGKHRISASGTLISLTIVWMLGFIVALVPVFLLDWEIYSSNGLCLALPFSSKQSKGWIFSFIVFVVLNFVLFLLIAFGQVAIFVNMLRIKKDIQSSCPNNRLRSKDFTVARKLAMVALTDFCCWFPIGILGFYSLNGYIFDREVYAWIAVFVLPINSALNPIVYTIPALFSKCKGM